MVEPGGNILTGPFLANGSSSAGDQTFTLLSPGSDGGLVTGSYQSEASPGFDGSGNSVSARIIQPTKFFGIEFGVSTNATDPQTHTSVPAPSVSFDSSDQLSGNLSAWAASWNNQEFNQGSPKPDGTHPGNTMSSPIGSYDPATGAFTIIWASQIVGGPFNNFTGAWHLEGTFVSANGTIGSGSSAAAVSTAAATDPGAAAGSTAANANGIGFAYTGQSPWPWRAGLGLIALGTLAVVIARGRRIRGRDGNAIRVEHEHTPI
jgi:hypothetical protein